MGTKIYLAHLLYWQKRSDSRRLWERCLQGIGRFHSSGRLFTQMKPILNGNMAAEELAVAKLATNKGSFRANTMEHLGEAGVSSKTNSRKSPSDKCTYRIIQICET